MSQQRRREGSCLICESWALGELCPRCAALVEEPPPPVLEKRTPPKGEQGHASPDWLWTVVLILFILVLLRYLGAI